jgi:ABC-type branched-subunit amino acid transport system substrate-binding protein
MRQRQHLRPHHQPSRLTRALPALTAALAVGAAGCGGGGGSGGGARTITFVVNAPFSTNAYVGETIARGVRLALQNYTVGGSRVGEISIEGQPYRIRVQRLDNGLSPARALANVRRAVAKKAVAIVDEGTGIDASWAVAAGADIPIGIVYQGGIGLVDPEKRPNVFRIVPTDHGIAFRLAEYLVPKRRRIGLLHDDTAYGQEGAKALRAAFAQNAESVSIRLTLPSGQTDLSPQILRARRAGSTALLVWGRPSTIANVLIAARSRGWKVPVYTPPAGSDPVVRQELADHPEWVDGLTFASGRMTAEAGPGPFYAFADTYRRTFGPDYVGVRTSRGTRVTQPPEFAMYAYDFVNVLVAAFQQAKDPTDGKAVIEALEQVNVIGANGDSRGFNARNHEGVIDDDVYFARFHDMMYAPVRDDPLSSTLPTISQEG